MFYGNYWTILGTLIALSVVVAAATKYILEKRPPHKHIIIISSATVSVLILALLFSQLFHVLASVTPVTQATKNNSTNIPTSSSPSPNPTIDASKLPSTDIAYDFEKGTSGWVTSEGAFKLALVSLATKPVHSGIYSLEVTTTLMGNANPAYSSAKEVYNHTEADVYFDQAKPNDFSAPGPYNLSGKEVSCFVFLPGALANQIYIRLFVKDTEFRNDFSEALNVNPSTVNHWIFFTFVVGNIIHNTDQGFDPTKVNSLGIRVDTFSGSTLNYSGSFFIDDCSIQH